MSQDTANVVMIHPFDPRGLKVGGIETYVRDYIAYHPDDINLIMVGLDGQGDLEIGKITELNFRGRTLQFLPVMSFDDAKTNEYAKTLLSSLTLRFSLNLWRNFITIRRIVSSRNATVELRRVEFAPFASALGKPFIQMLHDGAQSADESMSSLLARYWSIKQISDRLALKLCHSFYCVNTYLTQHFKAKYPKHAHKVDTLTTWANPAIFYKQAFRSPSDILRVVYAGRLDLFKNPSTMFKVITELNHRLEGKIEFHYIGDGEIESFAEFQDIEQITVRHGKCCAAQVAETMASCDVGILTSGYEGMPRFVMEMLASGRPVCALHLPQLESVITSGRSGELIERSPHEIFDMASAIIKTWRAIREGAITPTGVSDVVQGHTPTALLSKIFDEHRRLQYRR